MSWIRLIAARNGRREILSVLAIWAALLTAAVLALLVLNWNAIRLINRIEYVEVGRYGRMLALYEEAKKRADTALGKLTTTTPSRIPETDPDYRAAVDLYQRALELDPRGTLTPEHSLHYEILMRLHEAAGAEWRAQVAMIREALARNDFGAAGDFALRVVQAAPGEPEALRWAAEVPLRAGRLDEATSAAYRMASVTGENNADVLDLRARIALARKDYGKAIQEFQALLDVRPEKVDARKQLATLLQAAEREDEALQVLVQGRDKGGEGDGNYMHRFGEALLKAGRVDEALSALRKAAELEPHSADVFWSLARAHQKAGNPRRSNQAMQRAFELKPELRGKVLEQD